MHVESLYQEIILDHYKHPHGKGLREPFDVEVHHVNPTCGDEITLRVRVENGTVVDLSYDGQGCSISQASASVAFDQLHGVDVSAGLEAQEEFLAMLQSATGEAHEPNEELLGDGIAFAGVAAYPARVKCALLPWMAWKDAVIQAQAESEGAGA